MIFRTFSDANFLSPLLGGLSALAQIALLPGTLVLLAAGKRTLPMSRLSTVLLVFCFSAVASFLILLLLHAAGWHSQRTWALLGFVEAIAWLYLRSKSEQNRASILIGGKLPIFHWLVLTLFLGVGGQLTFGVLNHWPGVFEEWDAVVSWNRWALDWTKGDWPHLTWGYPQMIPALWSLIYLWQGSTEIEFFARAWMGLFPVALLLLFLDAFLRWKSIAPLLAGIAMAALLLGPYSHVADSGYVDVPVTFFTLLTGYWVLLARQEPEQRGVWLLSGAVAAAAALLTKQGGMLALGVLTWGLWTCRQQRREIAYAVTLLLLLALPWFLLLWLHGMGGDNVHYVTSLIYGQETVPQRVWRALSVNLPAMLLPGQSVFLQATLAALAAFGLLSSWHEERGRFLAAVGLAHLLTWAAFFSYDGRNLLPGLPFLLLSASIGIENKFATRFSGKIRTFGWNARGVSFSSKAHPAMYILLLIGAALPGNTKPWDHMNNSVRKQTGDAKLNQQLIQLVDQADFSGYIYTTYPQVAMINELRHHMLVDYGVAHQQEETVRALQANKPFCLILATLPRYASISHVLLHRSVYPAVIDAALANGSLQMRLSTPALRLLRVNCPTTAGS